ncbi:DNA (cytosine-5-)-methyltransferase [Staphylococcus gallinarum]|uniref:DNA (cytosine-5-)-methyltransferase n=1 Tax=Staphylococcus gallinarum TaxID=1293 RepID=UPI000E691034|nr:DNA (cytosine-5-)-methyltransferase [Staphylococcus gallinarum]RIL22691.1 DNA (cytosine-5-)-methyltransferase [Staphylococcus gallinarum]RIO86373.1 DNA (cytosine-5-)-methyltransferase [Staphylococcus gallinarum]
MNFIDICSGIGGFRSALEKHGHKCLAFAEIDKYAKQSYKAIYETDGEEELNDITTITDDHFRLYKGRCDIITGGFPCQAFSIAGNRRGFDDTRGTIFFHIARAIKEIQPSYVLLENVKGLFSHDKGRTFGTIIQALDELGYVTEWGLFNSKYWGVPQNRERVYILVTRKDVYDQPKLFDLLKQQIEVTTRLVDVLEDEVDEKYYLSEEKTKKLTLNEDLSGRLNHYDYRDVDSIHSTEKVSPTLNTMQGGDRQPKVAVLGNSSATGHRSQDIHDTDGISPTIAARDYKGAKQIAIRQIANIVDNKDTFGGNPQRGRIYDSDGLSPSLNCMRGGGLELKVALPVLTPDRLNKRQNGRRFKEDGEPMFTLTSQDRHGITDGIRIRKLTPLECWRLQGFSDEQFYKAKESGVSNSQLYKQVGNSVTVKVVDAIVKCL